MWLECHQRSAWKYQHAECNYTLFLWGSATFKNFPCSLPSPSSTTQGAMRLRWDYLLSTSGWKQSRAVTGHPDLKLQTPRWGGFPRCLQKGQPILQQLKSSDLGEEVAKNSVPALLKQVTHLLLFIKLLVLRERFLLLKNKNTPLQPKKKCFHLLILNFHLKQILSFKTKCFF